MPSLLAERTEAGLNPRQAQAASVRPESRFRSQLARVFRGLIGIGVLAAIWQITPNVGLVNPYFVSPLSEVLAAWWDLLMSGQLWTNLRASLIRSGAGFGLALVIGVPLGAAIAWYRVVRELTTPVLEIFRNTAALALLPVFLLVLGIGETSKIAIVLYACFFPILLNTISGVSTVDKQLLRSAKVLGLGPVTTFRKVVLPAAVPTIFTGIRIAGATAVLVLIAAELIGATAGLGYLITYSQNNFLIPQMYAAILTTTAFGLAINYSLVGARTTLLALARVTPQPPKGNDMTRKLNLNAFLMSTGHHESSWRLPESDPLAEADVKHYQRLAQIAERGKLDSVFFADGPLLFSNPARRPPQTLEPTLLLSAMAVVTERIGLIATASTTYEEPYNLARRFGSLDKLSHGRAGWNVVTTGSIEAGANFGYETSPTHAERYDRAGEFLDVVLGLWSGWEDDATVADKAAGVHTDPTKVHPLDHVGKHFQVRGPLTVGRSEQGYPVIVQAGSSGPGIALAAAYAEAVFTATPTLAEGQAFYRELKAATVAAGRNPDHLKILPGIVPILGGTEEEAKMLERRLDELLVHEHALEQLANDIGIPAEKIDLDAPLPENIRPNEENEGHKSRYELTVEPGPPGQPHGASAAARSWVAVEGTARSRGRPEQVADNIELWFTSGAADGFNVMPAVLPSGLEAFVDHVVPILQRRGLFREDYESDTLRGHYGLPVPAQSAAALAHAG